MTILRYTASADNTITNVFLNINESKFRATGSNMGSADILETFSIFGKVSSSISQYGGKNNSGDSSELSRVLIKFPIASISADRTAGKIPAADSVSFHLKMYNAVHPFSLPHDYSLSAFAISSDWEEGTGLDMENYTHKTLDGVGSNWMMRASPPVSEITKVVFNSSTKSDYGAGTGAEYLTFYNNAKIYHFWFDDGSGDSAPDVNGTEIEVDIQAAAASTAGVAGAFQAIVDGRSEFSANIIGSTVYVTASTAGTVDSAAIVSSSIEGGQWAVTTLSIERSGTNATPWTSVGGDYHSSPSHTQELKYGDEDISIDVTTLVEQWIAGTKSNYGFIVKLSDEDEAYFTTYDGSNSGSVIHNPNGAKGSRFTKTFFGRSSEFFFKRPVLEARFDSSNKDDRGRFYLSSSLLSGPENLNSLYFYNYFNGKLTDYPGYDSTDLTLELFYSSGSVPEGSARSFFRSDNNSQTSISATRVSTGTYKASIAVPSTIVDDTYPYLVDVWSIGSEQVFTGSAFLPKKHKPSISPSEPSYVVSMPGLKNEYKKDEINRMRLYVRKKGWSPNIYSVAQSTPENFIIVSGSYRVLRSIDDYEVISHDVVGTALSYDVSGNYFDISTNLFEPGFQYKFKFSFYDGFTNSYTEQPYEFKFRVVE